MFEDWTVTVIPLILGAFVVLVIFFFSYYIVRQWERVALIRLGRIVKIEEKPGLHFKIPLIDTLYVVDMRMQTIQLKGQTTITKDNISLSIDTVVFTKVEDPMKVILQIEDYKDAVAKYAQTSIRDVMGKYSLDDLLMKREEVANTFKDKVDELSKVWGVDITKAEIQDISLPDNMKRALAVKAEADREAQAVVIKADAELKASSILKQAADNMKDPNAMQLRILAAVSEASKEAANTVIMALPLETLKYASVGDLGALASINSSAARRRVEEKSKRE
ncbi:MAG: SPFH domain-containing protein [Candidatus Bathyarchaeia archaeon]|jgi:regulator of protease activity HflC (stomatin/prohibitin superfamily)